MQKLDKSSIIKMLVALLLEEVAEFIFFGSFQAELVTFVSQCYSSRLGYFQAELVTFVSSCYSSRLG